MHFTFRLCAQALKSQSAIRDSQLIPQIGSRLQGYVVRRVQPVPEFSLTAIELVHEKTDAKHLHLLRPDDPINSFCVSFRTTPQDNTGVAHILEHLSLCGSQNYPCRDPFMKMLSRSLATFMNACTGFDVTYYPFSTQNVKDFDNLLSVYLDATYFPLLQEHDFLQEGWRLERENLHDPQSPYQLKGVVLNEMKDVYGSASNIFVMNLVHHLMPDTIYANEFGGHPFSIPDLDNNQVKQFHRTHYHPSNAKFFTYGDQPLEFYLGKIDSVLNRFDRNVKYQEMSSIDSQPSWKQERNVQIACPPELFANAADQQVTTCLAYLLTEVTDNFENLTLNILASLLVDGQNAPFYEALIASNLGKDYSPATGYVNWTKQSFFSVGLQGIGEEGIVSVHQIIQDTFEQVRKEGFPPERVEAILHSIELSAKHQTASFGLNLISSLNSVWNHEGDPMQAIQLNQNIQRFRQELANDPQFLIKKVDQYFIQNNHRLKLTMRPNQNYVQEFKDKQAEIVKQKLSQMTSEDLEKNHQMCLQLSEKMNEHQDASVLPCLQVDSDIKRELPQPTSVNHVQLASGQTSVQVAAQNTNSVTYFRALAKLDLSRIPSDLVQLLPLFCSIMSELGADDLDRKQLSHEIDMNCSGLNTSIHIRPDFRNGTDFDLYLLFHSYCLNNRLDATLNLWSKVFNDLHFNNPSHIGQLIKMNASNCSQSIVASGHMYAALRSSHSINPINHLKEQLQGVDYVSRLSKIAEQEQFEQTIAKLQSLSKIVFDRRNLQFSLNTESQNLDQSLRSYEQFFATLPSGSTSLLAIESSSRPGFSLQSDLHEHYVMPFNSNYVSKSLVAVPFMHPDYAKYQVLSRLMSRKYLHSEIREKGSAYGSGMVVNPYGVLSFYSYRDPNLQKTLNVFDKSFEWASNDSNFSEQDINEAKIGVFKDLDKPIMPGAHGNSLFLDGVTDDMLQQYRLGVLAVKKGDILKLVKANMDKLFATSGTAVLGPESEETGDATRWKILKQ